MYRVKQLSGRTVEDICLAAGLCSGPTRKTYSAYRGVGALSSRTKPRRNHILYMYTYTCTGCGKKYITVLFLQFFSSCLEFKREILQMYLVILYAHNSCSI